MSAMPPPAPSVPGGGDAQWVERLRPTGTPLAPSGVLRSADGSPGDPAAGVYPMTTTTRRFCLKKN